MFCGEFLVYYLSYLIVSVFVFRYFWRDFDGSIPEDAYAGGIDENNKPIYIAQIYSHNQFLIPAKLYYNDKTAYYEYNGKELSVKENIKVLCTQQPERFEWLFTSNEDIKHVTNKYLVKGGYEPGCTTYIGRMRRAGEVLVGKALTDNLPVNAGLYVTKSGTTYHSTTFEVLAFNWKQETGTCD
ncbi:hypothetical protein RI129_011201 [Pyrocoelia pectoralis]|uniref:Uncharacterized protein n=1 Tax=Pyrocoelia pectoralis TaxID=417401 RepID=A0AAN7V0K9_9COLE